MKAKMVALRWRDSARTTGWRNRDSDYGITMVDSVGFLVSKSRKRISISTSLDRGGDYLDILSIPRKAIVKIQHVKLRRVKR